jgi:hypothetical protein
MANFKTEPRGYWKVTRNDLEKAKSAQYDGIDFIINGDGARWEDGSGVIHISKESDGWTFLVNHIARLDSFSKKNENSNSKKIPAKLKEYFKQNKI